MRDLRPTAVRRRHRVRHTGSLADRHVTYTQKDGILAGDLGGGVLGITTDESQNIWLATHNALYVMRAPRRRAPATRGSRSGSTAQGKGLKAPDSYAPDTDIHLQNNPIEYTDKRVSGMPKGLTEKISTVPRIRASPRSGAAGPERVFVGTRASTTTPIRRRRQHVDRPQTATQERSTVSASRTTHHRSVRSSTW